MSDAPIPLVDLAAQHAEVASTVQASWDEILRTTAFINGPAVQNFEAAYAEFAGVEHCVGVSNGTDALELAMRASGISAGDEVILPANSFVATAESIVRLGATPVFVDCDPRYHLIDAALVADRITERTRAIAPVHLYGQMADMRALEEIVEARPDVCLIEDAAQAHGARQEGRAAGAIGVASGTSFYPGKNLGAYGDAGAVLTNSDDVARQVRLMRDHGSGKKYVHETIGWNCRLDALQAAVLSAKLRRLQAWNEARRTAARRYDDLLEGMEHVVRPATLDGNEHVWHLYVVQVPARDDVLAILDAARIGAGIHYPIPIHLQPAFADLASGPGSYPVAEAAAQRILSLPLHPHLTAEQQERVVSTLDRALQKVV
jgi:dTDP-4-amino-4,6-dideoxygalactose transaminase